MSTPEAPRAAAVAEAEQHVSAPAEGAAGPDGSGAVRLGDGLGFAARVMALVWAGWALIGLLGTGVLQNSPQPKGVPGLDAAAITPGWHNMILGGNRADALWYQRIAAEGYRGQDGDAAFFPLYPMLIDGLSATGLPALASGLLGGLGVHVDPLTVSALLISQLAMFGALVVMYALTTRELGVANARRAVRYLAVFPAAFFLFSPFTEPLFLLLVLLAFWFARSGRWWWVIAPALLAGLSRSVGVVMVLALGVEAIRQLRAGGHRTQLVPKLLAPLAPAVGIGLYFAYWAVVRHDVWAPLDAQKNWGREFALPTKTLTVAVESAFQYQSWWLIDLLVTLVPLLMLLVGIRLLPLSYTAFGLGSLLMPLCDPFMSRPLMSVPRFVAVLFPAFWVLAILVEKRLLSNSVVIGFFAGGFTLLGLLFVNSYFIF